MSLTLSPITPASLALTAGAARALVINDDAISVTADYAATGDGVTDDTAAIQAAITAGDGKVIVFPPGDYVVSSLTLRDNITLVGLGDATLKHKTGTTLPLLYWPQSPRDTLNNVTISGLTFEGESGASTENLRSAIYIVVADTLVVEGCKFSNFKSAAIHIQDAKHVWVRNNKVVDCATTSGGRNAIELKGTQDSLTSPTSAAATSYAYVTGNFVSGATMAGIAVVSPEADVLNKCVVADNIVVDCDEFAGIAVEAGTAKYTIVANNQCYDCIVGIDVLPTTDLSGQAVKFNIVQGNIVDSLTRAASKGIICDSSAAVVANNIIRASSTGIQVAGNSDTTTRAEGVTVTGNKIIGCNTSSTDANRPMGIQVTYAKSVVVTGNQYELEADDYGKDGINLNDVLSASVTGNLIAGPGRDGIRLTAVEEALIADNTVIDANANDTSSNTAGITLVSTACDHVKIRGNLLRDTRGTAQVGHGVWMTGGTNIVIADNDISNPETSAIRVDAGTPFIVTTGAGSPESSLTAAVGSVYRRTDGGADTVLYAKESGTGNTGWSALAGA